MLRLSAALLAAAPLLHAQPALLPEVRLVAGRPDTLVLADLSPAATLALQSAAPVAAEMLGDRVVLAPAADAEGVFLLPATLDGEEAALMVRVTRLTRHVFRYDAGSARPEAVFVIGAFNGWSRTSHPLTDADGDGVYERAVQMEPGRYPYKFTVDGEEVVDPANPDQVPNDFGAFNNVLAVAPRHAGRAVLRPLRSLASPLGPLVGIGFERTGGAQPLALDQIAVLVGDRPAPEENVSIGDGRIMVALNIGRLGPIHSRTTVRIAVTQPDGLATPTLEIPFYLNAPQGSQTDAPFVWKDAVLYQVLVDRFANGDPSNDNPVQHDSLLAPANYHGGDLEGLLDKIESGYFGDLGVTALWLSPVVQNTDRAEREYPAPHRYYTGYHGYWPTHPEKVDEHFGDMALLQQVVDAAHARGLKVLLDFVANHTHEEHPFFQQHRDWYGRLELPNGELNLRKWDEQRLTTWFEPYLPSFDYERSDEALEAMTDNAVWWLETSGADGFRHDAVKHIPNRFWRTLTRKVRERVDAARIAEGRPPVYQIGETFGSYELISSYVRPGQLDAQFNFNLYDAALTAFLDSTGSFAALAAEQQQTFAVYGQHHVMGNLMDSHDKTRFAAYADGDLRLDQAYDATGWLENPPQTSSDRAFALGKLYTAYLMTIPGVPTVYYGNEILLSGGNDPDNRRPMRFEPDRTDRERLHHDEVARLVRLRTGRSPLRHGHFETLHADANTWAYLRADLTGVVLVVLNKSDRPQTLALDIPEVYRGAATDALSGLTAPSLDGRLSVDIPALGYRILDLNR